MNCNVTAAHISVMYISYRCL